MRKTVVNKNHSFSDFNVIQYGHEDCLPSYSIGNFVRSNYLIHYIHRGRGIYRAKGKEYRLSKGDAFLIYPGDITYYAADAADPWEYSWLEFSGDAAAQYISSSAFSKEPIALGISAADKPMRTLVSVSPENPYELLAAALNALCAFSEKKAESASAANEYVKSALNYIHTFYYHRDMTVEKVGSYIGIDRSYLYRLFKEKVGVSPKKYIMEYKLKTAERLLRETSLSIGQVARSAGFEDQLYFSTAFSRFFSKSPTEYRKECRAGEDGDEKEGKKTGG